MSTRPTRLTDEMKKAVAAELVADLIKEGHLEEDQTDDAIRDIMRCAHNGIGGYELAKELDDRCHWDCDLEMATVLDDYSFIARNHIDAAQRAWFESEKPKPPAQPGDRVSFIWGRESHTGTIDSVFEHGAAQFTIKIDGDGAADTSSQRRAIVNWEDVTPLPAGAA